jgi:cobalamin biosynthesis protein CbiD
LSPQDWLGKALHFTTTTTTAAAAAAAAATELSLHHGWQFLIN